MTSALASFRDPPAELVALDGITPLSGVQNNTGSASPCGITDVEGNIAYFNKLCVASLNGVPQGLSVATSYGRLIEVANQTVSAINVWTPRTWSTITPTLTPINSAFAYNNQGLTLLLNGLYELQIGIVATGTTPNGWLSGFTDGTNDYATGNVFAGANGYSTFSMMYVVTNAPLVVNLAVSPLVTGLTWGSASLWGIYLMGP